MNKENSYLSAMRELGEQVAAHRLRQNITQQEMAKEAGVSRKTIMRLENGQSIQLDNFLRIISAMDLLENIKLLIPETKISPMQQLILGGKERTRASSTKAERETFNEWLWRDEG